MRSFFDDTISSSNSIHVLSEEESKHICKVLRLAVGDEIALLDGKGSTYICSITDANPKKCTVTILKHEKEENSPYSIHIAIAPTKMMDRLEWFLEKATEIGVTEITPIISSNSERKQLKTERLEKILIAAMKQSKRTFIPILHPLTSVSDFIQAYPNGLIAHCYATEKDTITSKFIHNNCPILIGPEGDFSEKEVELALNNGYQPISLGKNRLRTETAGLYAVMQAMLSIQ